MADKPGTNLFASGLVRVSQVRRLDYQGGGVVFLLVIVDEDGTELDATTVDSLTAAVFARHMRPKAAGVKREPAGDGPVGSGPAATGV